MFWRFKEHSIDDMDDAVGSGHVRLRDLCYGVDPGSHAHPPQTLFDISK